MIKKITKEFNINCCDFCDMEEPLLALDKCVICGKDICSECSFRVMEGRKCNELFSYSIVCPECLKKGITREMLRDE